MHEHISNLSLIFTHPKYPLQTPQSPIVRTASYTKYCMDEFPTGTNAIVAVLAYTGYNKTNYDVL